MLKTVLVKAHAKVNLALHVTAKRSDGFHEVDTIMARIALADRLWLKPQRKDITLKIIDSELPNDSSNLAYKAAEAYLETANIQKGVHITLKKQVPIAAGLGGGSSDAAAVLRSIKQIYPTKVDLLPLAERLGADVPFFVNDLSMARATGKGEYLQAINLPKLYFVLVNPGIAISAREAYESLQSFTSTLELPNFLDNLKLGTNSILFNALQAGIINLYPEVDKVLRILQGYGFANVLMSGSGSTCFALAQNLNHARKVVSDLKIKKPKWWVSASYTL